MDQKQKELIDEVKRTKEDFDDGYLEGNLGYKFRTKAFMDVIFLYTNSVDVRNPDILGRNNRNTFIYESQAQIEKIKEQIRLDIKDLNFTLPGASTLASFIPKAANRKVLEDNDFSITIDEVSDNAADYGSGFLKVWEGEKGELKMRSIDPYAIYFNQYNFKSGMKVEKLKTRTVRDVLADKKYDASAKTILSKDVGDDPAELNQDIELFQAVRDNPDGTQEISVVSLDKELVFYEFKTKSDDKIVSYYKFDYKKRKGFPDALGVGCNEKIFNKLVQSKVNRERLDKVMEIATKLPFQKQIDNERDNMVGKEVIKLDTGVIMGHKGNPISVMQTGGEKQVNLILALLQGITTSIGPDLNVSEALQGNTMPSGTSGVLGNLLTENSSSVLKEVKKDYAKFLNVVYKDRVIPYILGAFNSKLDLRKYLEPNDIRLIEQSVIDYMVAQKQIDAAINDVQFSESMAREEVKSEIKGKALISGDLLKKLREEVKGIKTYISGEDISKAQTVSFLREMRSLYSTNPDLFKSSFFVQLLKKEAEFDSGVSGVEIDELLREINRKADVAIPAAVTA